jgi:hypothetical protein
VKPIEITMACEAGRISIGEWIEPSITASELAAPLLAV